MKISLMLEATFANAAPRWIQEQRWRNTLIRGCRFFAAQLEEERLLQPGSINLF
jgi:hypothetical protein